MNMLLDKNVQNAHFLLLFTITINVNQSETAATQDDVELQKVTFV